MGGDRGGSWMKAIGLSSFEGNSVIKQWER